MGLDITYYRKMTEANGNEAVDETGELKWGEGWLQFYVSPDFPGREDGLTDWQAYKAQASSGFHAGSYREYNHRREQLAGLAGWAQTTYEEQGKAWPSFAASGWYSTSGPFW